MNALRIIESALRLIGNLSPGETAEAGDVADALDILNDMLDSWSTERLVIFNIPRLVFNLVPGQQVYQYGQGAPDFNSPRPARIERMGIVNIYSNPTQPLEIPIDYWTDVQKWSQIPVKQTQSALPTTCYDDSNVPYRNLSFYPVPNTGGVQAIIYAWGVLQRFANLKNEYNFPPGYARAIRFNLAVELAAEFNGHMPDASIVSIASRSKANLSSINAPDLVMYCDPAIGSTGKEIFNWLTGESR